MPLVVAISLLLLPTAWAHQPTISDGSAVDAEHAIEFADVQVSRVAYHEVTAEAAQLWITFQIDQPQQLKLQLGVPLIERLAEFRPALALLGPGLPEVDLPFDTPQGLGGRVFTSDDVTEPEAFDEPFTGTSSWIVVDETVELPAAGRYYVVAYVPSGETGKLWTALGELEVFDLDDIAELAEVVAQVRAFHEVPEGAAPPCFLLPLGVALTALPLWRLRQRSFR